MSGSDTPAAAPGGDGFRRATAVQPEPLVIAPEPLPVPAVASSRWSGTIEPGWDIVGNANGGYLLAITARAPDERGEERSGVVLLSRPHPGENLQPCDLTGMERSVGPLTFQDLCGTGMTSQVVDQ